MLLIEHDIVLAVPHKDRSLARNTIYTELVPYFQVTMSYLEIYNEHIRDLLAPEKGTLDLRDDSKKGIHVAGLTEANTTSTKEVHALPICTRSFGVLGL